MLRPEDCLDYLPAETSLGSERVQGKHMGESEKEQKMVVRGMGLQAVLGTHLISYYIYLI